MKLYRGQDRRILKKAKKCMDLIAARDARVLNPKKTSTLSNRVQIIPAIDATVSAAFTAVKAQIEAKLAANA